MTILKKQIKKAHKIFFDFFFISLKLIKENAMKWKCMDSQNPDIRSYFSDKQIAEKM
jgi:hypothetical protein